MDPIFRQDRTVGCDELDSLRHASNIAYVAWMQEAAIAHSSAAGWPAQRYLDLGAGWVVHRHEIDYLSPAGPGDPVAVYTWVATMERVSSLRRYEIVHARTERLLARAATDWVFVNLARQRPTRIPPELRAAFPVDPRSRLHDSRSEEGAP